ncbi:tRNA pseudouridine(13) synthase TruD [Oxyplasma meridianum]|uniref:Probable tRNA pseudouridine synthase D n=1 Tax=Oxyplasma meridianum TaxID=3073602 RepID=A0AAX4NH20_9ARCH
MPFTEKEREIGIYARVSSSAGIPGKIKNEPEDFIVDEIPVNIPRKPDGKYLYLRIRLRNWDNNRFLMKLSRELGVSRKRITYAGTKDKTAVTTQYFCINTPYGLEKSRLGDVEILETFRSDHMLKLGELLGNRFIISIEDEKNHNTEIMGTYDEILSKGGFPNYFGIQRFGSIRTNTHKIGKYIVNGDLDEAVKRYIGDPDIDHENFRLEFYRTLDAGDALKTFPMHLNFERSLLSHIAETGDFKSAFSKFPLNLRMIFVHAYQSYLFNIMVSERFKRLGNLSEVSEGDIAIPVDRYFNPVASEGYIKVTKFNLDKISRLSLMDKVRVTAPLVGYETNFSGGVQGDIENHVMEIEKVSPEMFRIASDPSMSSSGERRIISAKPVDLKIPEKNTLDFSLGRGIYATSLLREILRDSD